jgi:hypothetical protein
MIHHQQYVVGEDAVSAFKTRLSTDSVIVGMSRKRGEFVSVLAGSGFEETDTRAEDWMDDTELVLYEN